ncbi:MAG: phenylalanine--tRNA ligase subunit alpha [Verrucomicrobiota bacterium]
MIDALQSLQKEALAELPTITDSEQLEVWRIKYLSRQGELPKAMEGMKDLPKEKRPEAGKIANQIKGSLQASFDEKKEALETRDVSDDPNFDPTMPGRPFRTGSLHVLTQTQDRMIQIFRRMGFALADGSEIETEHNNFDALNTPQDHPARNEQDTFYLDLPDHPEEGRYLLRTHTSPVQIRVMQEQPPPIQIIAPGRCYRRDEIDATHGVYFHQMEGLLVDKDISLADLKGVLEFFFQEFLGADTLVRFRPHFFPFTEPSFEVDFSKPGLKIRGKDWVEIAGCGMVDPAVFTSVGIDPEKYSGFAFGMGIERMAMILHEIPDLRLFSENDVRFLNQFA